MGNRIDYVRRPAEEGAAGAIAAAAAFVLFIAALVVLLSVLAYQRVPDTQAGAAARPVCPDYGTEYHSCER